MLELTAIQTVTDVNVLRADLANRTPGIDDAIMAAIEARIAELSAFTPLTGDAPTKEQWKEAQVVGSIEGKISFISPKSPNSDYRKVTIATEDNVNEALMDIHDEASDNGHAYTKDIYGVKKAGRKRVVVSINYKLLADAKSGYSIVVPVEATIANETTYMDSAAMKANGGAFVSAFHKTTALRTAAPQITSGETAKDEEDMERDLAIITDAKDAGFANALATYLGARRK